MALDVDTADDILPVVVSEQALSDSEDDDNGLAMFLEAEVLGSESLPAPTELPCSGSKESSAEERSAAGRRVEQVDGSSMAKMQSGIVTGSFEKIPPELFPNILKFLSSEDLSMCAGVNHFLRLAANDESLWRRLYCLRWGAPMKSDRTGKLGCAPWKQLYFERDQADMVEFVRNTPAAFREYYIQMQAAKRSQAPLPSQMDDDLVVIDTTIADQITAWRRQQKLPDIFAGDHYCSGRTCSYYQMGDIFLCEKTGRAHVCDDTCKETILDPSNELLVCPVSGRCFDRWLTVADEQDETDAGQQLDDINVAGEEMGAGRLGRAYLLGYSCEDEQELDEAIREVQYPGSSKAKMYCDWQL